MSQKYILKIHPKDNVLVALSDLKCNSSVNYEDEDYILQDDIPAKHKFATENLDIRDPVYMYGVLVGRAKEPIVKGGLISTANLVHDSEHYSTDNSKNNNSWEAPDISKFLNKTFIGYHREDGKVGTENNWLIIPLVFCQNRNVEVLKQALIEKLGFGKKQHLDLDVDALIEDYKSGASADYLLKKDILISEHQAVKNPLFPNVSGIHFLTHEGGCGGATSDSVALCHLLAGYINNPNVAGATVLSLGCQHAQASILQKALSEMSPIAKKTVLYFRTAEKQF